MRGGLVFHFRGFIAAPEYSLQGVVLVCLLHEGGLIFISGGGGLNLFYFGGGACRVINNSRTLVIFRAKG